MLRIFLFIAIHFLFMQTISVNANNLMNKFSTKNHQFSIHKLKTTKNLPDLTIKSVFVKENIKVGSVIGSNKEIYLNIANIGQGNAPKSILKFTCRTSQGMCPKSLTKTIELNSISRGKNIKVFLPHKPTEEKWPKGSFYITATIQLKNVSTFSTNAIRIKESNTRNNTKYFTVRVKSKGYVDLSVTNISLSSQVCADKRIDKSGKILVKIRNFGTLDAPKSSLCVKCAKIYPTAQNLTAANTELNKCPSYLSGTARIPPIKSGEGFVFKWPINTAHIWEKGSYKFLFIANCRKRDLITEHNTTDNNNKKIFNLNVKTCKSISANIKPIVIPKHLNALKKPVYIKSIKFNSITPSHWTSGETYNIFIQGDEFNKNIEFKFEKNISILLKKFLNKKQIVLKIKVSHNIKSEKVKLMYRLKNSISGKYFYTGLYGWIANSLNITKVMPKFKIKPITADIKFPMGKIILEAPNFGSFGCGGDVYQDKGIPKLNDKTVFKFREENPGLAENFQLQIIRPNGKVLLVRNLGKTKAFHTDPEFVYQVLKLMNQPLYSYSETNKNKVANFKKIQKETSVKIKQITKQSIKNSLTGLKSRNISKMADNFNISSEDLYMNKHRKEINLLWKIIGIRSYKQNRVAKGIELSSDKKTKQFVTFVVEQSDAWPLSINDFTTGLACSKNYKKTDINIQNIDFGKGKKHGNSSTVNYTQDRIEISGSFDLEKSPWAYRDYNSNKVWVGPRNIFVSWGDGTVEPLDLKIEGQKYIINSMQHQYLSQGTRNIRVFMLPEDDIQHNNPSSIVSAYDYYSSTKIASNNSIFKQVSAESNSPYYQTLKLSGRMPSYNMNMVKIAKHAYMFYCYNIEISPREDLVALGALHLDSISFTGYNGGTGKSSIKDSSAYSKLTVKTNQYSLKKQTQKSLITNNFKKVGFRKPNFLGTPVLSKCDVLQANAKLKYYGKGGVKFKWTLYGQDDSKLSLGTYFYTIGPSKQRKNLTKSNFSTPTEDSYSYFPVDSKILELDKFTENNKYWIGVDVTVDALTALSLSQEELLNEIKDAMSKLPHVKRLASNVITPEMLQVAMKTNIRINPYLSQIQKSGVKLGVLSPSKHPAKGFPMVASINEAITKGAKIVANVQIPKRKPYFVAAKPFIFQVAPILKGSICKFKIVTKSGDSFFVKNISKTVKSVGNKIYSGKGDMIISLNAGNKKDIVLPVVINRWRIGTEDGITVVNGRLDTKFSHSITQNGMNIELTKLRYTANGSKKSDLELTLNLSAQDSTLRAPGTSAPLIWKNIASRLDENGNWIYFDKKVKEFSIGWSGFRIKSKNIIIDLSQKEGKGVNSQCAYDGNNGVKWTGIHMGNAVLIPNTFNLLQNNYEKTVTDWGIAQNGSSTGLCGQAQFGHFSTKFKKGRISFNSIKVKTMGGNFKAVYKDMDVYVPWLDTHLKGDAKLLDGQPNKEASVSFTGLKASAVSKSYGPVDFEADNLIFGSYEGVGWGVWSDTTFSFFSKNLKKVTDKAILDGLIYGMDGRAHLIKNKKQISVPLGGKAEFGKTTVDLIAVDLNLHPNSGSNLIDFILKTNFTISKVMPTVSVPVGYSLNTVGDAYSAKGPIVPKFNVPVAFPSGNPNVESKVSCEYKKDAEDSQSAYNFSIIPNAYASLDSNSSDQFSGTVDMAMFGAPSIKAEFRLGYKNGKDYWMIRASKKLPGVAFITPLLYLYEIRGGLGYGFPLDSFKHAGSINNITPSLDGNYMFFAGMNTGTQDKFTFMLSGDLAIKIGKGARLDLKSWILKSNHGGDGDCKGFLQFAGGSFDGAVWGKLDYLHGMVALNIPQNAVAFHVSKGSWYLYVGRKDGPRVNVHLFVMDSNGYLEFEPNRLALGAGQHYHLNAGIGYVDGNLEAGCELLIPPHISGYAEGSLAAKVCCCHKCIGPRVSAGVTSAALPFTASTHACISFGIFGDACATFSL